MTPTTVRLSSPAPALFTLAVFSACGRLFLVVVLVLCGGMSFSRADACNATTCRLPDCACPSTEVPDMEPEDIPQMVVVMFDGRLSEDAENVIRQLFPKERKNPNKCPIVSTFYVSNENTNYCSVNRLWAEGHEIGVNGITRHTENYWRIAEADQWDTEVSRQVENLQDKAGISHFDLPGWRTPQFAVGADTQFDTLNSKPYKFEYDATLSIPEVQRLDNQTESYFPFTLDYPYTATFPECSYKCPEKPHPGLWELPVLPLRDGKKPCNYLNACPSLRDLPQNTYALLHKNFDRHFKTNRSPFTINVATSWLIRNKEGFDGLNNFIVDMVKYDEVWVISAWQVIQWAQRPRNLGELDTFTPWGCFAKRYKRGCAPGKSGNRTAELFPGLFGHEGHYKLLLYQYIALAILFLVIFQYDRNRK